jgi:hypothetical protein
MPPSHVSFPVDVALVWLTGETTSAQLSETQDGATALMLSAKFGHAKCLRMLLEKGADKDARGKVRFV